MSRAAPRYIEVSGTRHQNAPHQAIPGLYRRAQAERLVSVSTKPELAFVRVMGDYSAQEASALRRADTSDEFT
jgi:hypothetical protein